MKKDCSKTVNFMPEKERMCGSFDDCLDCPLNSINNSVGVGCEMLVASHTDKALEIVQKWSDEHQPKTYTEDFFEKFPSAPKVGSGVPTACWDGIYGGGRRRSGCDEQSSCKDCWNRIMEDKPND